VVQRWIFRLNIPVCIVLGILVFNANDSSESSVAALSDVDYFSTVLFSTSIVPLLVGMSVGGSLYEWTDWRTIVPIAIGCVFLALFVTREVCPHLLPFLRRKDAKLKPLLDKSAFGSPRQTVTFVGAMILGMFVSASSLSSRYFH
jgi:MFS family permease